MAAHEAAILDLLDAGESAPPARRAGLLHAHVAPRLTQAEQAATGLGDRDRAIWAYRRKVFGTGGLETKLRCAACDDWVGLDLGSGFDLPPKAANEASVTWCGTEWTLRLPTQADLEDGFDPRALSPDAPWEAPDFVAKAEAAIDRADPAIDVTYVVACPACGFETEASLDPSAFLWRDLAVAAGRILDEVAALARAYGWTETAVLALSPRRRARYLERAT